MAKKILFVIDMQNDFIDGTLGSKEAVNIVPNVVDIINNFGDKKYDMIFYTMDTHNADYLKTLEGKNLPIEHCIENTKGWELNEKVKEAIDKYPKNLVKCFKKNTFGSLDMVKEASLYLWENINSEDKIYILGLCTDICVISNAILLRAKFPNLKIYCYEKCCAGTSTESHNAAITILKTNQIEVI